MRRALTTLLCLGGVAWANGLLVEGGAPVRLRVHRVTADVTDRVAHVVVEQVFRNSTGETLEGTYVFPLPRSAVAGEFAMTVGDRRLEGEVLDAETARRVYRDIVRRRRDPALLEYVGRGLFRARVFPIAPHGEVTLHLAYRQVLEEEQGTVVFRYPLASDRLNGVPVETAVVDVRYAGGADLRTVYSSTHAVDTRREGARAARVTWEGRFERATRDFEVCFGRSADDVGVTLLSSRSAGGEGTFLAVVAPRLAPAPSDIVPKDVVYVLDVSGSMKGRKIEQAKRALRQAVDLLRPEDRFNVVAFSSDWQTFEPALVEATPARKGRAHQWIEAREAGGGTALEAALATSLRMGEPGRLFLVVLVTDGKPTIGITGADDILEQARKANRAGARVFTFGVGNDLDVLLLDRLAEATGGARDYIAEHEEIDAVTQRFFRRVDQPLVTDVSLELPPGLGQVYPRRLPDLFAGSQVVLMGRYAEPGPVTLRIRGRRRGADYVCEWQGTLAADGGAPWLERMWAHRKIAFLLDEIRLHGPNPELADEIVALATRHGIVTPYTAGLVVEEGEGPRFASRGRYRGPNGAVPPGLRPPADPESPACPSPAPAVSRDLKRRKEAALAVDDVSVKTAADKTFRRDAEGRWVDCAWDGKTEPRKIEAFSDAWFDLVAGDDRIARYLAVGDRVVLVLDGEVWEVTPG